MLRVDFTPRSVWVTQIGSCAQGRLHTQECLGDMNRTPWFGERNDRKTELGGWGEEERRESLEGDYDKNILISQTIKYYFF